MEEEKEKARVGIWPYVLLPLPAPKAEGRSRFGMVCPPLQDLELIPPTLINISDLKISKERKGLAFQGIPFLRENKNWKPSLSGNIWEPLVISQAL